MCRTVSPVIFHKSGFCPIHQGEVVFRRLVPLNSINAVGMVVVAGDDDTANQLFGTLILEVLLALLVQCVPGRQQGAQVVGFPFSGLTEQLVLAFSL